MPKGVYEHRVLPTPLRFCVVCGDEIVRDRWDSGRLEGRDRFLARRRCNAHKRLEGAPEEARFWQKVEKDGPGGCWLWRGPVDPGGYGRFKSLARNTFAHRWSYEVANGPIPDGLELDHLCRVHGCVNPEHLEAVTHKVNMERGIWGAE